jgi:hypothetical protein
VECRYENVAVLAGLSPRHTVAFDGPTGPPEASELTVETEELQTEIAKVNWYHSIPLGNDIVTPGVDNSSLRLAKLHLPEELSGKSVLDVGAWEGFFSFEAERGGAEGVLATDSFCWGGGGWGT